MTCNLCIYSLGLRHSAAHIPSGGEPPSGCSKKKKKKTSKLDKRIHLGRDARAANTSSVISRECELFSSCSHWHLPERIKTSMTIDGKFKKREGVEQLFPVCEMTAAVMFPRGD